MYIRRCGRGSEESSASMIMCTFLFRGVRTAVAAECLCGAYQAIWRSDGSIPYGLRSAVFPDHEVCG